MNTKQIEPKNKQSGSQKAKSVSSHGWHDEEWIASVKAEMALEDNRFERFFLGKWPKE
jgi:hypothetical protein